MDALSLDQMLPEYQAKQQEIVSEIIDRNESDTSPSPSSDQVYESGVGSSPTVLVTDEVDFDHAEAEDSAGAAVTEVTEASRGSTSSSGSLQMEGKNSGGSSSIYHPSYTSSAISSYDRDSPSQKLIAIFGRQFDLPEDIANCFQRLLSDRTDVNAPEVKFVPFTLKRRLLLKGSFDSDEIGKHDLICMCYNASEARILLTGNDGFYTSLLRHTEAILGSNKVVFLITHYSQQDQDDLLISPALKTRLYDQEPLRGYLDCDQVFSWRDNPSELQATRLIQLSQLEKNPQNMFTSPSCLIL